MADEQKKDVAVYNMLEWVEKNEGLFKPPICNELMYKEGQLKVMFVGGPNSRKDYHIEEGEELFYMLKGDMCLKIMEKGKAKDVVIKEGEIFVLPSRIPHSPQRKENTVGLVIERERLAEEMDGLSIIYLKGEIRKFSRYYCDDNVSVLFEKWFHCVDLVKDLPSIVKEYMDSEQCKTGKPIPGTIMEKPPIKLDTSTEVHKPFNIKDWIKDNRKSIKSSGMEEMFSKGELKVCAFGAGKYEHTYPGETFLWQIEGNAELTLGDQRRSLKEGEVALIPAQMKFSVDREEDSIGFTIIMDPYAAKVK